MSHAVVGSGVRRSSRDAGNGPEAPVPLASTDPHRPWLPPYHILVDCPIYSRKLFCFAIFFCRSVIILKSRIFQPPTIVETYWTRMSRKVQKETRAALVKKKNKIWARLSSIISNLIIFEIFSSKHEYPCFYVYRILMRVTGFDVESARHHLSFPWKPTICY